MASQDTVPVFWVIGHEVTEFLSPETVKEVGRLVYMGLWDESEMTFICSLTPSGYVRFWGDGFFTEKKISNKLWEELIWSPLDDCYFDYRGLSQMRGKVLCPYNITLEQWQKMIEEAEWAYGEGDALKYAYQELVDEALDYLGGNTMECEVAQAMNFKFDFEQEREA